MGGKSQWTDLADVARWLAEGVFTVRDGKVYKGDREIVARRNTRKRCSYDGYDRVDLYHEGKKRSIHVSQVVWIDQHNRPIPEGFEIHHLDKDPDNNAPENLVAVSDPDHRKLHKRQPAEDIPF